MKNCRKQRQFFILLALSVRIRISYSRMSIPGLVVLYCIELSVLSLICCSSRTRIVLFQIEKACLGDILYRYITVDQFSPDCLLDYLDLSSEYSTLEIANRIETALHFWRTKYQKKKPNHTRAGSFWGSTVKGLVVDVEKSKLFAHRAETLLKNLKLHFPSLPQTALDVNKIQYNKVQTVTHHLTCLYISQQ